MEAFPIISYRPLHLMGEHNTTIDDKSRLIIPSEFRKGIFDVLNDKRLVCHVGRNRTTRIYPEFLFRAMVAKLRETLTTLEEEEDFDEAYYGMAYRFEWDAQGRIVLPATLLDRGQLKTEVTIVGAGDAMVLRNRENWKTRAEELLEKMPSFANRKRKEEQNTTTTPAQPPNAG